MDVSSRSYVKAVGLLARFSNVVEQYPFNVIEIGFETALCLVAGSPELWQHM